MKRTADDQLKTQIGDNVILWDDLMTRICGPGEDYKTRQWSIGHCASTGFQYLPTPQQLERYCNIKPDTWIQRGNVQADGFFFDQASDYHRLSKFLSECLLWWRQSLVLKNVVATDGRLIEICAKHTVRGNPSQIATLAGLVNTLLRSTNQQIAFSSEMLFIYWYPKQPFTVKRPVYNSDDDIASLKLKPIHALSKEEDATLEWNTEIEIDAIRDTDFAWDIQTSTSAIPFSQAKRAFELFFELTDPRSINVKPKTNIYGTDDEFLSNYKDQSLAHILPLIKDRLLTEQPPPIRHRYKCFYTRLTIRFRNKLA